MNKKIYLLAVAITTLLYACKKNDVTVQPPKADSATGLYILTEGSFNSNNANLSFYNVKTQQVNTNIFKTANNRDLGDVANDLGIYGSKMYIVVNNSNSIEILDAHTVKSIKHIDLKDASFPDGYQPRRIAFANGKAYVTTYVGKLLVIDTASNAIIQYADTRVGCEGIAITNNKAYISVPGVYPNTGQTILSILDLGTLQELKTITVGSNPGPVLADQYHHLYVVCAGDYATIPSSLSTINLQNDQLQSNDTTVQADNMAIYYNKAYLYKTTYLDDSKQNIITYDVEHAKVINRNFITDGTAIHFYYGITTDEATGDVYVIDALSFTSSSAKVTCFDANGKTKFSFELPDYASFASKIAFLR
ncbi:hypothetical protein GA0116948_11273 [Chitinophaga costaii]|uniref:40-residue YVTN family beta-propeller repeat-containing protein n=1 Tax=Chitinophaga costaii TaxID=1335309 RepID=A0A1C4F866_9BACT|nr:DUF5074 domain-containing protein [Chitinophaga costaii]PUZ21217.1 hypothetical protein DCM91_16885 [Chitinophaga costaii]SCC51843.1 hypothetical protein GA0116948_11273 [Chitinophaga costaii]